MPFLVVPETIDTVSTDANCIYEPAPLGGAPIVSPNIKIDKKEVKFYTQETLPEPVTGVKVNPLIPTPCQPGNRVIVPSVNTTVFFNKKLPAVQGDKAQLLGTDRPLTGPFGLGTVQIASKGKK